ncbi:hypothetical protein KI387_028071, partial [Taxus chinensis]
STSTGQVLVFDCFGYLVGILGSVLGLESKNTETDIGLVMTNFGLSEPVMVVGNRAL